MGETGPEFEVESKSIRLVTNIPESCEEMSKLMETSYPEDRGIDPDMIPDADIIDIVRRIKRNNR